MAKPRKPSKEEIEAIRRQLAKIDAELANEFTKSIDKVKSHIDWHQMEAWIAAGRYDLAVTSINQQLVKEGFSNFAASLTDSYIKSGKFAAEQAGTIEGASGLTLEVRFDMANPAMFETFHQYKDRLITNLTSDLQNNVKQIIVDNINAGNNPQEAARLITTNLKDSFGLTDHQERAVQNFKYLLESRPKEAMTRMLRDKRFDPSIVRAIEQNEKISAEKIEQMVNRYRERFLRYRATTISRTESIRIMNESNRQLWRNMVDQGTVDETKIKRFWVSTQDDRTRDWHRNIGSLNPEGVGMYEPFKTTLGPLMYPGDSGSAGSLPANIINCRCYVFMRLVG